MLPSLVNRVSDPVNILPVYLVFITDENTDFPRSRNTSKSHLTLGPA